MLLSPFANVGEVKIQYVQSMLQFKYCSKIEMFSGEQFWPVVQMTISLWIDKWGVVDFIAGECFL